MLKLLIAGRRATGKTREAALGHLRHVHGPLVYDAPPDAGAMPSRYVQNHVVEAPDIPALSAFPSDRDLVTEIWFEDVAHLKAATQTPYYTSVLQPDEANFVDQASVQKAMVLESMRRGREPADAVKLFVILKRRDDADSADFEQGLNGLVERTGATGSGASASLLNTPMPSPGGGSPFADAVLEIWFMDREAARMFCAVVLAPVLEGELAAVLDPAASACVLAEEYPVARLRASTAVAAPA